MKLKQLFNIELRRVICDKNELQESWASNTIHNIKDLTNKLANHRYLYHVTESKSFINMMKRDDFRGSSFEQEPESLKDERYKSFISTSSTLKSAYITSYLVLQNESHYNVLIVFNGRLVKRYFTVVPVNFFEILAKDSGTEFTDDHLTKLYNQQRNEKEFRIMLETKRLSNLSNYIDYVIVVPAKRTNNRNIRFKEMELRKIKQAAKENGVKLLFTPNYSSMISGKMDQL